ncbi:MAG: DUF3782 domain-containing protein [Pseudomonadota bacterium]
MDPERASRLKEEERHILKALPALLKRDAWFRREVSVILSETLATKDDLRQTIEAMDRKTEAMERKFESLICEMRKDFELQSKATKDLEVRVDKGFQLQSKATKGLEVRVGSLEAKSDTHSKAIKGLEVAVDKGFQLQSKVTKDLGIKVDTVGARWGIFAESTIRNTLRELLLKDFKVKEVKEWKAQDKDGFVFGYPQEIQVDLLLKNKEDYVVEIKSSAGSGDVTLLHRKAKLYTQITGTSPKMIFVAVNMNKEGRKSCQKLNIELITYDDLKD